MQRGASERLPEIPEAEAVGETAKIYDEIKSLCGVPMVALIYRHLATIPGALEWAWENVYPALADGGLQEYAWSLPSKLDLELPSFCRPALRVAGVDQRDERCINAILNSYNRANPVNVFVVKYLNQGLARGARESRSAEARELSSRYRPPLTEVIPPIVALDQMSFSMVDLVVFLGDHGSVRVEEPVEGNLIPSLYRHLAHWPGFLSLAANSLAPNFDGIARESLRLNQAIERSVTDFVQETGSHDRDVSQPNAVDRQALEAAFERFAGKIPEMIVIGTLLQRALPSE